ncbi:uncharacterized protein LOC133197287 [Saccostrea echinata]|uniref:uncharacterized protein LOC133197287 n=1 Tax=Saccostrea echinata TaxID=191078 RepID=UPI002A82C87B|nr:uncharacterized protein LOC133197287 [Saccostrea echinata]XP_061189231.1 uncharacterized protein LOC133197287 [Saccostrea echinata]
MEHLTSNLILLAVIISCVFALVPKSNMKCECTCSPKNNPSKKYLAVGNFEASFKPKTETVMNTETIPSVPEELLETSAFRNVDSFTKQDSKSLKNKTIKESESKTKNLPIKQKLPIAKKVPIPPVPPVLSYSSNPIIESTISPTTVTVQPDPPIDLGVTPSAFRKAQRMTLKESNEPTINKILKSPTDSRKINQLTKSEVITLDDIIFGKVPYDFGSRGIQRKFLTETKELDTKTNKPTTMESSKTTVNKTTSAKTTITETTASKTPKSTSTSSATETTASETTVLETTPLETTAIERSPSSTSPSTEMSSSTTPTTITTTDAPTTMQTTTKTRSNRGLLPLFRTAYSPKAKKSEKPKTTIAPTTRNTEPEIKTVTTTTKTTTPSPTTTTRKQTKTTRTPTTTVRTTVRPTIKTTQRPSTKKQPEKTSPRKATYNVQRPKFDNSAQSIGKSLISQSKVNPTYSFSDSFKRNTIKNLLDAFKPNYMKKDLYTVTPNPQPKRAEVVQPYRPPARASRMQLPSDIQFGRFDERVARIAPSYQVHSLGSLSSMQGQPTANSPGQSFAVLNSPKAPQQVVYQDRVQSSPERMSWNPVQEAKKWGEPVQEAKKWGEPQNWALSQQQQQQTWNSQNRQSWNSQQLQQQQQQQQRNLEPKKPAFLSPGFAIAGEAPQVPQKMNPPFPGLQLPPKNQSPIDFRVH